jgi:dGTPase
LATLGAFTKYPCASLVQTRDTSKKSQKKFGFFKTEQELFNEMADQLGLIKSSENVWARHPLAFLVEAADDICYNIIDLEDGCRLGLVSVNDTIELLAAILGSDFNPEKAERIKSVDEKIGVLRAMAIGKLITDVVDVFLQNENAILSGSFDQALTDLGSYKNQLKQIIDISITKIYRARHVVEIESAGFEVLPGLLEEFIKAAEHLVKKNQARKYSNLARLLPTETTVVIQSNPDNTYLHFREVIDFVSGMTDTHALSLYRKINGFEI